MSTSAQYADEVRTLKAQHAPRGMVAAAVETYTILSRKEAAAENLRILKSQGATSDEVREANNVLKSLQELDAAREKVVSLKASRATPSEVKAAVEHYRALKAKAQDPPTYPLSPEFRPSLSVEIKAPTAAALPASSYSSPLTPIPEHGPLKPHQKAWWRYGFPSSLLLGAGVGAVIAYYWHRIDQTYLQNSVVQSLQTAQPTSDEPGRIDGLKITAGSALTHVKWVVHLLPPIVLSLSSWASFQLSRTLRRRLSMEGKRGWLITTPVVGAGIIGGLVVSGFLLSFTLQRMAAHVGLRFLRTLVIGGRAAVQ